MHTLREAYHTAGKMKQKKGGVVRATVHMRDVERRWTPEVSICHYYITSIVRAALLLLSALSSSDIDVLRVDGHRTTVSDVLIRD